MWKWGQKVWDRDQDWNAEPVVCSQDSGSGAGVEAFPAKTQAYWETWGFPDHEPRRVGAPSAAVTDPTAEWVSRVLKPEATVGQQASPDCSSLQLGGPRPALGTTCGWRAPACHQIPPCHHISETPVTPVYPGQRKSFGLTV